MKRRTLSSREEIYFERFVRSILQDMRLRDTDGDLLQMGRLSLWELYCEEPAGFFLPDGRGWVSAYERIRTCFESERKARSARRWHERSMDQPVNEQSSTPLGSLLVQHCGDHQNTVCFFDYLDHLERKTRQLAYGLLAGYSQQETQRRFGWSADETAVAAGCLREKMTQYECI